MSYRQYNSKLPSITEISELHSCHLKVDFLNDYNTIKCLTLHLNPPLQSLSCIHSKNLPLKQICHTCFCFIPTGLLG